MKYFVTGATGFVGGRVARMLIADGHQVVAVVRTPARAQDLAALGVEIHKGDVTDKASMRAPMTGVDGVFHIAGWYKVGGRDKSEGARINIDGTRNVLELMKELGIKKGVYTSTLAINSDTHGIVADERYQFSGQHISEYDRTKAEAHKIAEQFIANGLPLVILMPGLIYGPGDTSSVRTTLIQVLQGKLPMMPQGTTFSWAHVDDIARAHIDAMTKGVAGECYIIAGPTHSFVDAMQIVTKVAGVKTPMAAPAGLFTVLSKVMGVVEKVIPVPDSYSSEGLRVIAGVTYIGKADKAKMTWGYNPRSLSDGWAETVRHEMQLLSSNN